MKVVFATYILTNRLIGFATKYNCFPQYTNVVIIILRVGTHILVNHQVQLLDDITPLLLNVAALDPCDGLHAGHLHTLHRGYVLSPYEVKFYLIPG